MSATIPASNHPDKHCTAAQTKPFVSRVWSLSNWERGQPKPSTLTAYRKRLACAGPENRKAIRSFWAFSKHRYYEHRKQMLWLEKYKPFIYPSGKRWAAPYPVALCESTENYYVGPAGAYGLILAPEWMSPRQQDEEAYRLLHTVGEYQAWARWEAGCAYR